MSRAEYAAYEFLCRQAECKGWMEAVINETLPDKDLHKSLGDGIFLIKLVNTVWPGSIPKYSTLKFLFLD